MELDGEQNLETVSGHSDDIKEKMTTETLDCNKTDSNCDDEN